MVKKTCIGFPISHCNDRLIVGIGLSPWVLDSLMDMRRLDIMKK